MRSSSPVTLERSTTSRSPSSRWLMPSDFPGEDIQNVMLGSREPVRAGKPMAFPEEGVGLWP